MHAALHFSRNAGVDALARQVLSCMEADRTGDAVRAALDFASSYGHKMAEANVLCALALEKAGLVVEALAWWDKCANNFPLQTKYLESALRFAWKMGENPLATDCAEKWINLLSEIFVNPPDIHILRELALRGHVLTGACGIHMGRIHAWLWLKKGEKPLINTDLAASAINLDHRAIAADDSRMLQTISFPLPDAARPYNIAITDASGNHLRGSPLVCSPAAIVAAPIMNSRPARPTVAIPVYDDRKATLSCLGSVFASRKFNKHDFDILVVWDHGPDEKLFDDLEKLARQKRINLVRTPQNYGFLGTVNHALANIIGGHVILLNSDTLVHGDWVDRMLKAASMPDAGTVTAMGSQAEHMSFPSWHNRAEIFSLRETALIDNACRELEDAVLEIPVGVGFCMLITRSALNKCGGLDGLYVCKGYGEESDFCLRVHNAGFINYGAFNVFVAHLQGRSFGAAKKALVAQNNKAVKARFPLYEASFDSFINADPARPLKEEISVRLCSSLPPMKLEIRPFSQSAAPFWEDDGRILPHAKQRAALFILATATERAQAVLKVRSAMPVCDMNFYLPQDRNRLEAVLKHFSDAEIFDLAGQALNQALQLFPDACIKTEIKCKPKDNAILPSGDNYLVEAPRNMAQVAELRNLATQNPHAFFYVYRLKKFMRSLPMPPNTHEMPELENFAALNPAAFVLFSGCDKDAWLQWLKQVGLAALPIFMPEAV